MKPDGQNWNPDPEGPYEISRGAAIVKIDLIVSFVLKNTMNMFLIL